MLPSKQVILGLALALVSLVATKNAGAENYVISMGQAEQAEKAETINVYKTVLDAYRLIGLNAEVKQLPWRRSIHAVDQGIFDAELARVNGLEKKFSNLLRISEPVGTVEIVALTKAPLRVASINDLSGLRIGNVRGILTVESLESELTFYATVNSHDSLIRMIDRGRIDVGICVKEIAELILAEGNFPSLMTNGWVIQKVDLYHYVNRRHKDLIPALERAVASTRK